MCNFFSAVVTRKGKVLWNEKYSSHETVIKENKLKDVKLVDRDFVRVELVPKGLQLFDSPSEWAFKVDEKGTLPAWFVKNEAKYKNLTVKAAQKSVAPYEKNFKATKEFIESISKDLKEKGFKPDGKPDADWKLFEKTMLAAARAAAWDAARATAGAAAWTAAWDAARAAARDAAGAAVGDAAWTAARDAVGDAARDAVWAAAGAAAGDAVGDAALLARCLLVKGVHGFNVKHLVHAKARWRVWMKGYGLRCDVNGVFYVYAKKG